MSSPPESRSRIRVRYAETDGMGVVYYGNYLTWFEVGRTDLLRKYGDSYREIELRDKIFLPVVEVHCRYLRPARYDDVLEIRTTASMPSKARLRFDYELERVGDGDAIATGTTWHVAVDPTGRPCRLPSRIREVFS